MPEYSHHDPRSSASPSGLPVAFIQRLQEILPEDALQQTLASFGATGRCTFRVNTLRAPVDPVIQDLRDQGLTPLPWEHLPEAWSVPAEQREALVYTAAASRGEIYIQNYSSMVPPLLLAPEPDEEVLDLAAAPGGKTLHMAALMQNSGRLAAVEVVRARYFRLLDNIERAGAGNVHTYCKDGTRVGRQVPARFDRVLLDAPCSSEARFRLSEPASWAYWSEKKIGDMQRKQKQLLYSGLTALKPGGRLVYSTCSFAPEENEAIIAHAMKKFPGLLRIEPIELSLANALPGLGEWRGKRFPDEVQKALRILPTDTMAGFFVCLLCKMG